MAIGLPLGIPLGIAMGNIALGPAMGLPIGVAIGILMENKLNPTPIELSPEEKARQKKFSFLGIIIGILLLISIIILFFAKLGS